MATKVPRRLRNKKFDSTKRGQNTINREVEEEARLSKPVVGFLVFVVCGSVLFQLLSKIL